MIESPISIELVTSRFCKKLLDIEEAWLADQMRRHFPQLYGLVLSGQKTAAYNIMWAQNIHMEIHPDGRKFLCIQDQKLAGLKVDFWWNGMEAEYVPHYL